MAVFKTAYQPLNSSK